MSIKRKIFVNVTVSLACGLFVAWQIIACLAAQDEYGTNLHLVCAGVGIFPTIVFALRAVLNFLMRNDQAPHRRSSPRVRPET